MRNNEKTDKRITEATKFIRKYCRLLGSGISFDREDENFHSFLEIETKREIENVPWIVHNDRFSIKLPANMAISIVDGKITNILNEELFVKLFHLGIEDMREYFKYQVEVFDKFLLNLQINEDECATIMTELFLKKTMSMMDKSFPVSQRAYDKWIEKGTVARVKKERLSSTFGQQFLEELMSGLVSFHDTYIENETEIQFFILQKTYSKSRFFTKEQMLEKAKKTAEENWKPWLLGEYYGICEILLRHDVGICEHYNLKFHENTSKVVGDIYGNTGKRLNFYTIFAGGYNIQRLHMRTIAHVYDS